MIRRRFAALLLVTLGVPLSPAARAERPLSHYVQACGLAGTPASVVVDVYDAASPGSLLATISNGEVVRIGTTTCYQTNLSTTSAAISFPSASSPVQKSYVLHFRDDASGSAWTAETVLGIPGGLAISGRCEKASPVYAGSPIPGRGLTQAVINAGKPSYMRIDVSCTLDFGAPDATYYEVYSYDASGRLLARTPSSSAPSP